jgi:hypothetical protein
MPLIKFENNKDEGFYLLVTSGDVGFFPDSVFGVTDHLLRQLDSVFREKKVGYHLLSKTEANTLVANGKKKPRNNPSSKSYETTAK